MPPCAYLPASLTRPRDRSAGVRLGAISPSRSWGHSIEIERGRGGYGGKPCGPPRSVASSYGTPGYRCCFAVLASRSDADVARSSAF